MRGSKEGGGGGGGEGGMLGYDMVTIQICF